MLWTRHSFKCEELAIIEHMKKFQNFKKHQNRFIGLATFIFLIVGIVHTVRIYFGWSMTIGEFMLTPKTDILAAFIGLSMAAMGIYYYFAKD